MDTTSVELCALAMLSLWLQHLLGYLLLIYYLYGYNICWVMCSCYAVFMATTYVGLFALAMLSLWIQHLLGYVLLLCCLLDTTSVGLCALVVMLCFIFQGGRDQEL